MQSRLFSKLYVSLLLFAAAVSHAAPGDLDTSGFGFGSGKVMTPIGVGDSYGTALALQPDGKLVVGGACSNGINHEFCIARYLSSGAPDTSFNATGKVFTPVRAGDNYAFALALQPNGNIVVGGACSEAPYIYAFCIVRYLPSGALDTSFNTTGTVITVIGSANDQAKAVAVQPDGMIVVGGHCQNDFFDNFCLARYLPNGALDQSFNSTGKVITSFGSMHTYIYAIALQPDGKIVVAGTCDDSANYDFCLARYLPTGALDTSFNASGTVITAIESAADKVYAIALQADGKIVVAGNCFNRVNDDFCVARYLSNGALDTSFNTTGKVITPMGLSSFGSDWDQGRAIALQPDGKIVVSGYCNNGRTTDFCIARYLPSGALDTTFNTSGKVITPIGLHADYISASALQPDGKIVVAGFCVNDTTYGYDFCLARYEGGPFDARNCSLDIDGDNQVLATTDALIHTRIALGMTGPAVISGITFASHAARQTWPDIRNYLVTQCGMSLAQ